jgi:uncharacterized protein with PIN domain
VLEEDPAEAVPTVSFRFYAELNDFLPAGRRQVAFAHASAADQSIKHLVEALGIPHTEVDLILVNGEPVDFDCLPEEGDRISVYPPFKAIDVSGVTQVRPKPLAEHRFVLDGHLGRLAAYLRMMGFDTLYRNDYGDQELAQISRDEGRILLTRDRGLLKRNMVAYGYWLRETNPTRQLVEVLRRYDLSGAVKPFSRCLACNGLLEEVSKEAVLERLPPKARQYYDEFRMCPSCGKLYWDGSHVQRMRRLIELAVARSRPLDGVPVADGP